MAMMAMMTTRNRGKATTTVTKVSAISPSVSNCDFISSLASFSNWSAFCRKYGLSCPPEVEVVTTPCRNSWKRVDRLRWAALLMADNMSVPSSSVSLVIHSASLLISP
ncbi:hypothetical protein DSECCO2_603390 [anaerobic digester metagenome]